ncbi:hypothetical protein QQS21_007565 [Conoideocrella luteorostrata]|uniref:Methyltransferase domain-containing protein n=1 Tax=Conoideocrella luteorostrata TaxID=1105319 RepID=A0AAJ0CKU6_9HYPO|nr:hypothetical protein QQS21_007565 [Conoideocrella luteorostrata]
MPTSTSDVAKLYDILGATETARLDTHPVELLVTLRAIREAFPPNATGQRIADVGGGPGKYAFALADQGHDVDLIDLSPGLLELAQSEQDRRKFAGNKALLHSLAVGNALDTTILHAGQYDAVLLLGPLYHLLEEEERVKAVQNAVRLAKPNAVIFVAFISIAAHLRDIAMREPAKLATDRDFYAKYVGQGTRSPCSDAKRSKSSSVFCAPVQIANETAGITKKLRDGRYEKEKTGYGNIQGFHIKVGQVRSFFDKNFAGTLELVQLRSQEGILGGGLDATLAKSEPQVLQAWADLMYEEYSTGEEHLGCADHLVAVLRKK